MKRLLPAYPLFVKDPYFSLWSTTEELNASDAVFWHGELKPLLGLVYCGEKAYRFLGVNPAFPALKQTELNLTAFGTGYRFSCEEFDFEAEFLSPLPPDDLELLSMPVCFLNYRIFPKCSAEFRVELRVEERIAYNTCFEPDRRAETRWGVFRNEKMQTSYLSLLRQMPLSQSSDEFGADWGTWYLCGETCGGLEENTRRWISAANAHTARAGKEQKGRLLIAFDDLISVFYFGEWLKGYWFRDGRNIVDAIDCAIEKGEEIAAKCAAFDLDLRKRAEPFGENYLLLLYASLRQSVAGHKLVKDSRGRTLFLSKECNSDGCIATVDVSYPSMPLYLLYAPELVTGMILPILDFAKMPVWEYDYAPHDAGVYPYCLGQLYAVDNTERNPDVAMRNWGKMENLPFYYLFPAGSGIYNTERQMPVEECGNLLILAAAAVRAGAEPEFVRENFDLFRKWAEYLEKHGLIPENQLCTDDFAGHLEKNANLSIKAIVALAAFGELCDLQGEESLGSQMRETARSFAAEWVRLCVKDGHSALTVGGDPETYSIKYNLAFDKLLSYHLFSQELYEEEVSYSLTKCGKFGIPLDSRAGYTKSDWNVWFSTLTEDAGKRGKILSCAADFLRETPDRAPYPDWYETEDGRRQMFQNRTVQGGIFILLLQEQWRLKKRTKK